MRHPSRKGDRFTTKPCLYSGLISRNLNLCYVLSTDNDMVKFPEVIIILWSRRRLSFFWEEIYSKYLELMCHGTYNYVFQCKSVCVFEGVSVWGRKRKKRWKEDRRESVMEKESYLIGGSRWRLYIYFLKWKLA